MNLAKYIRNLLFRYECVIVPEFGGFLTKTISAQIDDKSNTIYPPSKRLSFNSQLKENDGLLANYIASANDITYEQALSFIDFEVTDIAKKLEKGTYLLEGIGVISLNDENKLVFEPDENANFLTESFGLSPIVAPEISRDELQKEEVVFDSISDLIDEKDIVVNEAISKDWNYNSIFSYAAVLAVLAVVGYFVVNTILKNNIALKEKTAEIEATQETLLNKRIQEATFEINKTLPAITLSVEKVADSTAMQVDDTHITAENDDIKKDTNSGVDEVLSEETTPSKTEQTKMGETVNTDSPLQTANTEENTTESITDSTKKYHIIAGAFRVAENAVKKVNQLKAKGYDAHVVGVNKWNLTQVAFASYATKQEAQKNLNIIKASIAKDAWLLVK